MLLVKLVLSHSRTCSRMTDDILQLAARVETEGKKNQMESLSCGIINAESGRQRGLLEYLARDDSFH